MSEAGLGVLGLKRAVGAWDGAVGWDVVEAEVPDRSVDHAVRDEGCEGADQSAGEAGVPVVTAVDRVCAANEGCAEEWCENSDELPHGWVVVGHDLK